MNNFIKGIIGGIGNIVPGLSGSVLLIILKVYDNCIRAISELVRFKNIKKNILYLLPIGLGIVLGTVLFGKIILYFYNHNQHITSYAFLGLILGTLPTLFKSANQDGFKKTNLIPLGITLILGLGLLLLSKSNFEQSKELSLFQSLVVGFVLAGSTIIPGISSTVLLNILGFYAVYLEGVANFDLTVLWPIIPGLAIGGITFSLMMNYLLEKKYSMTYYAIIGFVISTLPAIISGGLMFNLESLICVIVTVGAFFLTYMLKPTE